jgi:hypothetical protein
MIQQRVSDPTGSNGSGIWVSPLRDVAHCFPYVLRRAIEATDADIGDNAETATAVGELARSLGKFIGGSVGEGSAETVEEHMKVTGVLDAPEEAQRIVGKWLLRAMLTLYFKSIREALHPGETPLGVAYLMKLDIVKGTVSDRTTEGS